MTFEVGMFQTLAIAVLAIYFGNFLRDKFPILKKYCIPSAVAGGTVFAMITTIFFIFDLAKFNFDYKTMNYFFYNLFFAATGLSASLSLLKTGGKLVIIFAILAALLAILQNILALGVGTIMGMNPLVAIMAGSTPLTGGHGNAASFGPIAEEMGGDGALEVAIAAATFGLITGCIMGGPVGRRIISKNNLAKENNRNENCAENNNLLQNFVNSKSANLAFFTLLMACGIGQSLLVLSKMIFPSVNLPIHVMCMFGGILIRLFLDTKKNQQETLYEGTDIVGSISLAIFVSLSIITMKLWQLASLALPLITILTLQLFLIYFFVSFLTFKLCGKNYDAAIISVGHIGFGLGAVPVSMATMNSVCLEYRYSKIAFFVVPLIGGFISNITNATIITLFLNISKSML